MQHTESIALDVLIIGAGLSGLGMAYKLKTERPHDRFVILEGRRDIGGTWDLFRYPGIRSDSDMYTFAFSFKPWKDKEFLGSGPRIKNYLKELVEDNQIKDHIRFEQRVVGASWDSESAYWNVRVRRGDDSTYTLQARFLVTCTGYYNYEHGYVPDFEGMSDFSGTIAHPQHWPQELDYAGKQVVVIGSGATAVTVVPAMAEKAGHVTMLQRSPTYVASVPSQDGLYSLLSRILPARATNRIMRAKYIFLQQMIYVLSRRFPDAVRKFIRRQNDMALQGSTDVDVHFNPRYKPWDERMCMVPNDDLFAAIREKRASILTDEIERFVPEGILLKSGKTVPADIVVPATGLDVQFWGGMDLDVDGVPVQAKHLTNYKGMMFGQVPNLVTVFGYTNAPWTLKAELTAGYVIRLLDHMQREGHRIVYPHWRGESDQEAIVDLQSGYIKRALDRIPKQGGAFPWRNKDLYFKDVFAIKHSKVDDQVLSFDNPGPLAEFHRKAG